MITASQFLKSIMDHLNAEEFYIQEKVPVINYVPVEQGAPYVEIRVPLFKQSLMQSTITAEMNVRIVSAHRGDSELQKLRERMIDHMTLFTATFDAQLYSLQGRLDKTEYNTIHDGRTHTCMLRFTIFAVKNLAVSTIH